MTPLKPAFKTELSDLAVLGGVPAFSEPIRVGRPNIGDRASFLKRVNHALDTRSLTNDGPYGRELEQRIAEITGVKHCIAVCNATIGLEIAIRASGLTGEVIVPSFTFVATAHALYWQGLTPVFADVDLSTHTLDPAAVERRVGPNTSAIIGVHLWGRACDVDGLAAVAKQHRLTLLFDAAQAFASSYRGKMIGNFGSAEVFSFHATKFINSFEGGAIATNDDLLASRARSMRNFGFLAQDETEFEGTNGKMSDISAAMGLTSIESLDEVVAVNQRNHRAYTQAFHDIEGLRVVSFDGTERHNYQYVVVEINEAQFGLTRDELQRVLLAENVLSRRYFYPGCHRLEPYASRFGVPSADLPVTERLARSVLCFPTGTAVDEEQIALIGHIVRLAAAASSDLRHRLAES